MSKLEIGVSPQRAARINGQFHSAPRNQLEHKKVDAYIFLHSAGSI
jgi:hypothetical protein